MPKRIANQKLCSKCQFRIQVEGRYACNYRNVTGRSRIFIDGKMAYDPKYCNKFKKGDKQQEPWRDTYYLGAECDEYTEYRCQKMRKEGHYKNDYRRRG